MPLDREGAVVPFAPSSVGAGVVDAEAEHLHHSSLALLDRAGCLGVQRGVEVAARALGASRRHARDWSQRLEVPGARTRPLPSDAPNASAAPLVRKDRRVCPPLSSTGGRWNTP
jgi:hypothetical protein